MNIINYKKASTRKLICWMKMSYNRLGNMLRQLIKLRCRQRHQKLIIVKVVSKKNQVKANKTLALFSNNQSHWHQLLLQQQLSRRLNLLITERRPRSRFSAKMIQVSAQQSLLHRPRKKKKKKQKNHSFQLQALASK